MKKLLLISFMFTTSCAYFKYSAGGPISPLPITQHQKERQINEWIYHNNL